MSRQVQIAAGVKDIVMPDGRRYQGGATVVLTDDEFSQVSPAALGSMVVDQGLVGSGLIDQVAQRIGAVALTTTVMTTFPGITLNVPACSTDVELELQFPFRMYQNGTNTSTPGNVTLSIQVVDETSAVKFFDQIPMRASSTDPWQQVGGVYRRKITLDRPIVPHSYSVQFQVSRADMLIQINPSFSGSGGVTLKATAA